MSKRIINDQISEWSTHDSNVNCPWTKLCKTVIQSLYSSSLILEKSEKYYVLP